MILVLGAGLSGLSSSYHIGHDRCLVLEASGKPFGHIGRDVEAGFTWDQGPHVSFTKSEYVRNLFADSVQDEYREYPVKVGNYFQGHWIDHPAQTALHQVPQPLRDQCVESFLANKDARGDSAAVPANYQEWLENVFGPAFTNTFPAAYTRKYWTVDARELGTDWIGQRMLRPEAQDVIDGSKGPLNKPMHYIQTVRYPKTGGYQSFAQKMADGCNIRYGAKVASIDLKNKVVILATGETLAFTRLVNTMPLPEFLALCRNVPGNVLEAAFALSCTQLVLVEATARHEALRPENWLYVYDEALKSTRINFTEKLSPANAPEGWTGVQTEVYYSRHNPLKGPVDAVGRTVLEELVHMGLLAPGVPGDLAQGIGQLRTRYVPWANVIFHHQTRPALEVIWQWLETHGLEREAEDTHPLTDWTKSEGRPESRAGGEASLFMAGRFGQWKYFWSDDCVLRGRQIASFVEGARK